MKDDMIPQLMPFMWISSMFMSLWIIVVLIDLYYYSDNNVVEQDKNMMIKMINYTW